MKATTAIAALFAAVMLSGCLGEDSGDIKEWMHESTRNLKQELPPLPEVKSFPSVTYRASDKPDPFNAARIAPDRKEISGVNKPDFDRPREQLEIYPLESIDFVGVVNKVDNNERYALVKVDAIVFQVKQGNYLGQNFGRIAKITDTEIVLTETYQDQGDQSAGWVEREVSLHLQKDQE